MVEASPVINTVIVALLAVAIVLIITKHYLASLCTSLISTLIIVIALVPCESAAAATDGTQYAYARNGAIKMKPKVVEEGGGAPGSTSRVAKKKKKKSKSRAQPPPHPQAHPPIRVRHSPVRASLGAPVMLPPPPSGDTSNNGLPTCNDPPPPVSDKEARDYIRNHGLYGVHGNLNCNHMQRSSVADHGQLQPLNARNQLLKFLAFDQPHEKDPFLIPDEKIPQ